MRCMALFSVSQAGPPPTYAPPTDAPKGESLTTRQKIALGLVFLALILLVVLVPLFVKICFAERLAHTSGARSEQFCRKISLGNLLSFLEYGGYKSKGADIFHGIPVQQDHVSHLSWLNGSSVGLADESCRFRGAR